MYPNVFFLGGPDKVTFVDVPGLQDTYGNDQHILDALVEQMKFKCPRINLFVLCFEYGKFDAAIQEIIISYSKLLND